MRYLLLSAGACASVSALVSAAPVTPVIKNDLAFGLARGTNVESTDHVRNGLNVGSQWGAQFVQSMEFDNLDGIRHNPRGNLLGMSFGATATGATIWNMETRGTGSDPGAATLFFDFLVYNGSNPGAELGITRAGGLSISPDNTRIAFAGNDIPAGSGATAPGVYVLNYAADAGVGGLPSVTNGRQVLDVMRMGSTQGTTWLDNNNFLALDGNGILKNINDNGTTLTATTVGSITLPGTGGNPVTSLTFEPTISPFVYAQVGQFTGAAGTPPNATLNRLYVLDPANNYAVVTTADYNTTMQTTRELAFGSDGSLYVSQFGTNTGSINSAIERVSNAWNTASLTSEVSTDYYSAGFATNFSGHDVAIAHPDYVRAVTVNLRDNATAVEYFTATSALSAVRAKIIAGYNGGSWNGAGINSSAAAADPKTGIGYRESAAGDTVLDTYAGGTVTVGRSSVYIAYTLLGDADVNRVVDIGDFALLAANFNTASVWSTGDFNYDGNTDIGDFAQLAANFNQSLPGDLPAASTVPEPVAMSLLAAAAVVVRRRRN